MEVRGEVIHVHHLSYGVFLMSTVGYVSLAFPNFTQKYIHKLSMLYGVSLGLVFDEAALWLRLDDNYYHRLSYDLVILLTSIFLLIVYFPPFFGWMKKIFKKKTFPNFPCL